jgi:Tol biopolymer transport system component
VRKLRASIAVAVGVALIAAGAQATASDPNAQITYAAGGRIHVVSADGSGGHAIATGGAPTWSPDGTMIAFHSARVPG